MTPEIRFRRLALFVFFFLPGLSIASWVTRTPAIRDQLGASTAEMGLVLFGLSLGSMSGILTSGMLVRRFGTRPVAAIGLTLILGSMFIVAAGTAYSMALVVAAGLMMFGAGMGAAEISINIEGAAIEAIIHKPVLHALHGFFSLGTVCGAVIGIGLTAIAFPVAWHLAIVAGLSLLAVPVFIRALPSGLGKVASSQALVADVEPKGPPVWKDTRLLLIGMIVLAMALAEGAANDWLPLLMVDGHGFNPTSGSFIFTVFAAAMTTGRFVGGYFLTRYGRAVVIRGSALIGALGLALVIFSNNPVLAGAAVVLWGLGASLGFPVALSAAGDSGPNPAARVSTVATAGYCAFLVGPPLLGFVGEHYGLRAAMIFVLVLVLIAACVAQAVQRPDDGAWSTPDDPAKTPAH